MAKIIPTLPEGDFRRDKAAVADLNAFLDSPSGFKFRQALLGGDPMTVLAGPENQSPSHLHDLAIAERGNADNLIGVARGYRAALNFIDRLTEELAPVVHTAAPTQQSRVNKALDKRAED